MQDVSIDVAAPLLAYDAFMGLVSVFNSTFCNVGSDLRVPSVETLEECPGAWVDALARRGFRLVDGKRISDRGGCERCGVSAGADDVHVDDAASVPLEANSPPESSGVGSGGRAVRGCGGGSTAGLRDDGVGDSTTLGKNTLRNRERRQRAKLRKARRQQEQRQKSEEKVPEWRRKVRETDVDGCRTEGTSVRHAVGCGGSQGFFSDCDETTRLRLRETRAKLLIAQNERRLVEEQRKLDNLRSPMQLVQDAMRMINFAESCAKKGGDNKIAGWAATVTSSYAESVARSAPSSISSLDSVTSANALNAKRERVQKMPLTPVERVAVDHGVLTAAAVYKARLAVLRPLVCEDFFLPSAKFRLTMIQESALRAAADDRQYSASEFS